MEKLAKLFARNKQHLKCEAATSNVATPGTEHSSPCESKSISSALSSALPAVSTPLPSDSSTTFTPNPKPRGLNTLPELVSISDTIEKSSSTGMTFLQRTSILFEAGRQKQSRHVFLICSVFLGLVVFTQICAPLFSLSDQLEFSAMNPAQLAGAWVFNDVSEIPTSAHTLRIENVQQHNCDLTGKGVDEFGEYELVGKLTPPNKIHLVKIHNNEQFHDTQVMDGELALDNLPLYAHGTWTRAHAIDSTRENLLSEGYWDANFYSTKPQPKFSREGLLRSPEALMAYLRSGRIPEPDQKSPIVVGDTP
ncbi:MAG TPA: hypothetical protein V6C89_20910 [Drouetiella sp.]